MSRPHQYTVLVTLLEGRYFPRNPNAKLYIQCRFNTEILTTDPVDHVASPTFDTELAWDLDTKVLSFLRSQRATLKLMCYSVDVHNRRDAVGYIVLDLRAAAEAAKAIEKFYPLINPKQSGAFRPEIKLSFSISAKDEGLPLYEEAPPAWASGSAISKELAAKDHISSPKLRAAGREMPFNAGSSLPIDLQDGFYRIGSGQQPWVLSVSIAFAENLAVLLDGSHRSTIFTPGLYFYYTFLGNQIVTEKFRDISSPNFPAEKVSIRIRALLPDLKTFLYESGKIAIYLCHERDFLGFADVQLSSLWSDESASAMTPLGEMRVTERLYPLYNKKQELPVNQEGKSASIGLSIMLQPDKEDYEPDALEEDQPAASSNRSRIPTAAFGSTRRPLARSDDIVLSTTPAAARSGERLPPPSAYQHRQSHEQETLAPHQPPQQTQSLLRSDSDLPGFEVADHPLSDERGAIGAIAASGQAGDNHLGVVPSNDLDNVARDATGGAEGLLAPILPTTHFMDDGRWHQFRFSIDLRSIREARFTQPQSPLIYFKYVYPAFGTPTPIIAPSLKPHPNVESEQVLPHSFCAFEFVMLYPRLVTYLEGVPLVVELWEKNRAGFEHDNCLGSATLDLGRLYHSPVVEDSEGAVDRKVRIHTLEEWYDVIGAANGRYHKWLQLKVVLALEDFGAVEGDFGARPAVSEPPINSISREQVDTAPSASLESNLYPDVAFGKGAREVDGKSRAKPSRTSGYEYADSPQHLHASHRRQASYEPDPNPGYTESEGSSGYGGSMHGKIEYKVALELELWKKEEERKFRHKLQQREQELMEKLSNEWKQREREREQHLKGKLEELKDLEGHLNELVLNLEARERKLNSSEDGVRKLRSDLERQHERKLEEVRDASRRLHEEYRHRMELHSERTAETEERLAKANKDRDAWEGRCKELESQLDGFRRSSGVTVEASLRSRIAELTEKLVQLERQNETLEASKKQYKVQLAKALKSIETFKRAAIDAEARRVEEEKRSLEMEKMRLLAKEEVENQSSNRRVLKEIQNDLDGLKSHSIRPPSKLEDERPALPEPQTKQPFQDDDERDADVLPATAAPEHDKENWSRQIRQLRQLASSAKAAIVAKQSKGHEGDPSRLHGAESLAAPALDPSVATEIERLATERDALLMTGVYTREDRLVRELDRRINELMSMHHTGGAQR
ncbi:Cep120 protein-domain-containing protein [Polychytrium aggregatum]|uniref:Cep120 protein-domain-containing protein n=1 Tax=Polychytrium aggregatum TaxID=110093 RepID=UPI0022FE4460|nr:Cep120 protein-domain-containing protein [Polychytrium aggregatum]KAI9204348.1 Cep120 protein-domain-containing protein [Polychytrium aggregatum]